MSLRRVQALAALVLMLLALWGAHAWKPRVHLADTRPKVELEALFPKQFSDWRIDERMPVQLISPDQAAVLDRIYNQTLSRTYVNRSGERIMLSVAYGGDQSDGTRAHRPEVCYPAQGFTITASSKGTVRTSDREVAVRRLMSMLGGRLEPITYWIVVGGEVTTSGTEQKLAQLRFGIRGMIPDGMLVRVSSIEPDMARGHASQAQFISDLAAAFSIETRAMVFGSTQVAGL